MPVTEIMRPGVITVSAEVCSIAQTRPVVYAPAARRPTFSGFANVLERVQAYA
jgi:hypothetical protein